jgi:hypothetical protein
MSDPWGHSPTSLRAGPGRYRFVARSRSKQLLRNGPAGCLAVSPRFSNSYWPKPHYCNRLRSLNRPARPLSTPCTSACTAALVPCMVAGRPVGDCPWAACRSALTAHGGGKLAANLQRPVSGSLDGRRRPCFTPKNLQSVVAAFVGPHSCTVMRRRVSTARAARARHGASATKSSRIPA